MKIETSRPPSKYVVSVCLRKSKVTVGSRSGIGTGQSRRRRLAGALGADLAFCLRAGGDGVLVENFEGAGRTSGDGAATWWCGSGRWVSTSSSISVSSSTISGDGMWALSMKSLVWSE